MPKIIKKRKERLLAMIKLFEKEGIQKFDQHYLARRFNVSQQQISVDIKYIMKNHNPIELNMFNYDATATYKNILEDLKNEYFSSKDKGFKVKCARVINDIMEGATRHFEKYGLKSPVETENKKITVEWGCIDNDNDVDE